MSADQSIAIFAGTPGQETFLAEIVRMAGYKPLSGGESGGAVLILAAGEAKSTFPPGIPVLQVGEPALKGDVHFCPAPTRPSQLIEKIVKIIKDREEWPLSLAIGPGLLQTRDNLWQPQNGAEDVRLTEKETAILVRLHEAGQKGLSRDELLHSVWSYVQGVETHTLETHIYRLRQKIEEDPSSPKIIITQGDRYIIQTV